MDPCSAQLICEVGLGVAHVPLCVTLSGPWGWVWLMFLCVSLCLDHGAWCGSCSIVRHFAWTMSCVIQLLCYSSVVQLPLFMCISVALYLYFVNV